MRTLMPISPETTVLNLLDKIINKGEVFCRKFLALLQEPDIRHLPQTERDLWGNTNLPSTTTDPGPSTGSNTGRGTNKHGYIHDVTKVLKGPVKEYFCAVLQEEKDFKVFVFQPKLYERFTSAEQRKTPVELKKCDASESQERKWQD